MRSSKLRSPDYRTPSKPSINQQSSDPVKDSDKRESDAAKQPKPAVLDRWTNEGGAPAKHGRVDTISDAQD